MTELVTNFIMKGYPQEDAEALAEFMGRNWSGEKAAEVFPKIQPMIAELLTQPAGTVEMSLPANMSAAQHAGLTNAIQSVIAETQKAYALQLQVALAAVAGLLDADTQAERDGVLRKALAMFDSAILQKAA